MKKERNSNIELLRIIAMIFILLSHSVLFSGIEVQNVNNFFNKTVLGVFVLGNIGVILFVLITGYFMIDSTKLKLEKITKLVMQTLFYSISIFIIFSIYNHSNLTLYNAIHSFFPITFKTYWFVTVYIVLIIFSPYINKMLNGITQEQYKKMLMFGLILFSVIPTFVGKDFYGNELVQIFLFYAIGGYIKKYKSTISKNNLLIICITTIFIIISSVVTMNFLGEKLNPVFYMHSTRLLSRNSIITILFSLSLFRIFTNRIYFFNKAINTISSCTFGVYLIHANFLVTNVLWKKIGYANFANSNGLIFYIIFVAIILFLILSLLEFFRMKLFELKIIKKFERHINNKTCAVNNFLIKLIKL